MLRSYIISRCCAATHLTPPIFPAVQKWISRRWILPPAAVAPGDFAGSKEDLEELDLGSDDSLGRRVIKMPRWAFRESARRALDILVFSLQQRDSSGIIAIKQTGERTDCSRGKKLLTTQRVTLISFAERLIKETAEQFSFYPIVVNGVKRASDFKSREWSSQVCYLRGDRFSLFLYYHVLLVAIKEKRLRPRR